MVQPVAHLTKKLEVPDLIPCPVHTLVEIDHEIFSTVIFSLPLIQERQLSVTDESMALRTG